MSFVKYLLNRGGKPVVNISPAESVLAAAQLMRQHGIGSLVVLDHGKLVGIVTERTILNDVVAEQLQPAQTMVGDIMSFPVICGQPGWSVEACKQIMATRRIRHLPILEGERLVGMISQRDLAAYEIREQTDTIVQLREYMYGYGGQDLPLPHDADD